VRVHESRDRQVVEDLIAQEGFAFFSPVDDGIDRQTYFQRCFPNEEAREYDFKRLVAIDNEVVVTYERLKTDGNRVRNKPVAERLLRRGCEALSARRFGGPAATRAGAPSPSGRSLPAGP
jgi:hypothetical protein